MAMLGKEIRMSRLVNPVSNKMMAITVDHIQRNRPNDRNSGRAVCN